VATANPPQGMRGSVPPVKEAGAWFMAMAVASVILGVAAIIAPEVAGLAVTNLVGWLLIFTGGAQLIAAFHMEGRFIWRGLLGLVYVVGGIYFLKHSFLGLSTLTILLLGIILVEAILEFISYFRMRGKDSAKWALLNAMVALVLGALIWFHWPSSSTWAIGTLVGANVLMSGVSRLMSALASRRLANRAAA
jgi:uncharacterized membrane protein HdeD (DUF308 family)